MNEYVKINSKKGQGSFNKKENSSFESGSNFSGLDKMS
jgi:hypothetical protein